MRPSQTPTHDHGDISAVMRMIAECTNRPLCVRLQAVLLRMMGKSVSETAALLGVHRDSIHAWIRRWNDGGLETLATRPGQGRPRKLQDSERTWIVRQFEEKDENGVPFTATTIYSELKKRP
jgi:transposase